MSLVASTGSDIISAIGTGFTVAVIVVGFVRWLFNRGMARLEELVSTNSKITGLADAAVEGRKAATRTDNALADEIESSTAARDILRKIIDTTLDMASKSGVDIADLGIRVSDLEDKVEDIDESQS